ncbi:cytochrome c4 [Motiliproteus coralliicola]|uniref:Cytochrome c4 n=1 Tax=Motiliproteus coralliicola TaxID=2283196 RepID=A0A369WCF9_9GAMM|nr:c-type cytochrome [Motiliproteus coralliicola]RDE18374.1 cytochrome c4 [Motiliproteus coralliicola]
MKKLLIPLIVSLGFSGAVMAQGDAAAGEGKAAVCFGCHGPDGNSIGPTFPKLAGQHENYLTKQLKDIKTGVRPSPLMIGFAAGLSDQDMADLSAFFAKFDASKGPVADEALVAKGKEIYNAGIQSKGVAACAACHAPDGNGNGLANFPAVRGQYAMYVDGQLKAFRSGARANDPAKMMRDTAGKLSDADIAAVSAYIESM